MDIKWTETDKTGKRQTLTGNKWTETDRNRRGKNITGHKWTDTERKGQKRTEKDTDRKGQTWTERDIIGQGGGGIQKPNLCDGTAAYNTQQSTVIAAYRLNWPSLGWGPSQFKQACCANCRRRPFPMKFRQETKSNPSVKWP